MNLLQKYGANDRYFAEATLYPNYFLARVVSQFNALYKIVTNKEEGLAEVSGKFRHETKFQQEYPAVGDFVMVDREEMKQGNAVIQKVLTRKSAFERTGVGNENQIQVVAANIDIAFICMALNSDYNLSRLERYLSIAWNSGATPVVILTKSDLCEELNSVLNEVSSVAIGVDIVTTSNLEEGTKEKLLTYLPEGVTASFMGSSGVGKSTLVNLLMQEDILATSYIRQDGKGRHTTTRREMAVLPTGAIVIDTPGMRELGVDSADLTKSFADIDNLALMCKFSDCKHETEPGCAVQQALLSGELDNRRLDSYKKLQKEARYDGLSSRQIERDKIHTMVGSLEQMKQIRNAVKRKNHKR